MHNQIFCYTQCITPKRATSLEDQVASFRPGHAAYFKEILQRWRAIGNTVSDLTGPRFEPQTSSSRDDRVTAQPRPDKFLYVAFN